MGMDLHRIKDNVWFRWNSMTWEAVLELAKLNGWIPMGTILGKGVYCYQGFHDEQEFTREKAREFFDDMKEKWDGNYYQNEFQEITKEDATNLADALERALPDIPGGKAVEHKTEMRALPDGSTQIFTPSDVYHAMNVFEKLAGLQDYLKDFIKYLRVNGCEIH